jgi:hypothetical protein
MDVLLLDALAGVAAGGFGGNTLFFNRFVTAQDTTIAVGFIFPCSVPDRRKKRSFSDEVSGACFGPALLCARVGGDCFCSRFADDLQPDHRILGDGLHAGCVYDGGECGGRGADLGIGRGLDRLCGGEHAQLVFLSLRAGLQRVGFLLGDPDLPGLLGTDVGHAEVYRLDELQPEH